MSRTAPVRRRLLATVAAFAIALTMTAAQPTRAELEHPRQEWLRDATGGLFLHWGMFTSPGYTDCAAWEKAVTDGGWDPDYWVAEAKKLRAQYLVLATFHSRLGYARAWPSEIPGTCSTKRDFLGETIAAGRRGGVKVILYMTDDPQWHNETGHESMDSAAYSAHKGRPVDLTTREGFGEFSYENFFEVMRNYRDLSGFWIDNDNAYWERNGLYEQIRQIRPSYVLSNNNEDTPIMDTISNEQKSGMTPDYDYPQGAYTAQPRLTEACFTVAGHWWYRGTDPDVDYRRNTGRFLTNAGSSIKSLMAEGAMVNGRFPPKQEEYNNFMDGYLDGIEESILDTEGGGYLHGGMQPGAWNDGAYGTVTVKKGWSHRQYVHVLTPPSTGDAVRLRDAGYRVHRVTDLRTGKRMPFSQADGYLTISGVTAWDPYDTVFRVDTSGRHDVHRDVRATVSAARNGFPAYHLVDGDYRKYWDNNTTLPVTITLDLGRSRPVASIALNQREASVAYKRSATEDSARIHEYTVSTSDDAVTWTEPKPGTLPSARGVQFVDVGGTARYVRLTVTSTWAAPSATRFHKVLGIDELYVVGRNVTRTGR